MPGHSQSPALPAHAQWVPNCHSRVPAVKRGQLRLSGSGSAVSGHPLYCLQSLVISYTVCSLLVIPCTVCSLWSSPVLSAVS
ncbi:unnamed protein product [Staurois parvus]|uniref:Uncharacterized protein n=1 Tax=Staurois parvus TaxID=386267 RepID=A0ABN9DIA8_9NEOB|nr:unnamed protein product [Staurois parvus]